MNDLMKKYPGEDDVAFLKRHSYYVRHIVPRLDYCAKTFALKCDKTRPISTHVREEIDAFWSQYLTPSLREQLIDYQYYDLFNDAETIEGSLSRYIPDSFHYLFIDDYYTNPQHSNPCDDKNLYDLYFHDVNRPQVVFRKFYGMFLDEHYCEISREEAIGRARDCGDVILKKGKFTGGGEGVMFWNSKNEDECKLQEFLQSSNDIICQALIHQHEELNKLNPSSVNSIRLVTLFFHDQVYMLSSAMRFGVPGSKTDNFNGGGMACGIEADGRLKNVAYDITASKHHHTAQGVSLDSIVIPQYDECVSLVKSLAKRFASVSRLVSWDLTIDEAGKPLLIECNVTFGGVSFHQLCNGPLYGDLTEEVLKDVFNNSYTLKSIIKSLQ